MIQDRPNKSRAWLPHVQKFIIVWNMSEEGIACRFLFTSKEYRRATRCFYRNSNSMWYFLALIVVVVAANLGPIVISAEAISKSTTTRQSSVTRIDELLLNFLPLAFGILGFVFLFAFLNAWIFRRSTNYNQEMIYRLEPDAIEVKNSLVEIRHKWASLTRASENKYGFVLFMKGNRSFHWLPKSGFDNPKTISRCRDLLREKVKDSKRLISTDN